MASESHSCLACRAAVMCKFDSFRLTHITYQSDWKQVAHACRNWRLLWLACGSELKLHKVFGQTRHHQIEIRTQIFFQFAVQKKTNNKIFVHAKWWAWRDIFPVCFTAETRNEICKSSKHREICDVFFFVEICSKIHGCALCLKIILRHAGTRDSFRTTPFGEMSSSPVMCDKA